MKTFQGSSVAGDLGSLPSALLFHLLSIRRTCVVCPIMYRSMVYGFAINTQLEPAARAASPPRPSILRQSMDSLRRLSVGSRKGSGDPGLDAAANFAAGYRSGVYVNVLNGRTCCAGAGIAGARLQ